MYQNEGLRQYSSHKIISVKIYSKALEAFGTFSFTGAPTQRSLDHTVEQSFAKIVLGILLSYADI